MKVKLRTYGYCEIINKSGNYALLKVANQKIVFNILGLEII